MYKITIKAKAGDYNPDHLDQLDGQDCQDDFTDYLHDEHESMITKGLRNGYMKFQSIDSVLWVITEYESDEKLTEPELDLLVDYTQGQWSDGIGEGFEQEPCGYDDNDEEIYVSPWFHGQVAIVEQNKI